MGKKTETPVTPDYISAALAQGGLNRDTALSTTGLNRPNEVGPYGTRTWTYTPSPQKATDSTPSRPTFEELGIPPRPDDKRDTNYGGVQSKESWEWDQKYGNTVKNLEAGLYDKVIGQDPSIINPGDWTVTTTLSPEQQRLYNLDVDYRSNSGEMAAEALKSFANQGNLNLSPESFSGDRSKVEQSVYDRATRLYGDQFGRDEEAFRTRLVNQGLDENSEAFRRQVKDFETNRSNAYMDAADRAVLAGGQEQSRLLSNLLTTRGAALNEAQSLASGSQVQLPTFQGFGAGSAGSPADILGATNASYNAALGSANAQNAANNANTQGAAALGTALLMYF